MVYAFLPQMHRPFSDSGDVELNAESTITGQFQPQHLFAFPHQAYQSTQFQSPGASSVIRDMSGENCHVPVSQLEAQERLIGHQTELLQSQLRLSRQQNRVYMDIIHDTSDKKGKVTASSSSSVLDCAHHAGEEEVNTS